jgi:hypothetical protein
VALIVEDRSNQKAFKGLKKGQEQKKAARCAAFFP